MTFTNVAALQGHEESLKATGATKLSIKIEKGLIYIAKVLN